MVCFGLSPARTCTLTAQSLPQQLEFKSHPQAFAAYHPLLSPTYPFLSLTTAVYIGLQYKAKKYLSKILELCFLTQEYDHRFPDQKANTALVLHQHRLGIGREKGDAASWAAEILSRRQHIAEMRNDLHNLLCSAFYLYRRTIRSTEYIFEKLVAEVRLCTVSSRAHTMAPVVTVCFLTRHQAGLRHFGTTTRCAISSPSPAFTLRQSNTPKYPSSASAHCPQELFCIPVLFKRYILQMNSPWLHMGFAVEEI